MTERPAPPVAPARGWQARPGAGGGRVAGAVRVAARADRVRDLEAIQSGPLERLLLPLNRRLAADITLPIRTLDIDPPRLSEALRYYHQHPEARAELATQAGLARVQHGRLTFVGFTSSRCRC
jgi:hypothetical protein